MSSIIYIASDYPLTERPNPHEKTVSVNEALALGVKVSDFLLEDGFDRNKPGVILVCDREINLNVDTGVITDGDFDDDFAVWLTDKSCEMNTNKDYCACLELVRFTTGRAKQIIEYFKEQLRNTSEIELWHAWVGGEDVRNIIKAEILIDDLTPEYIEDLLNKKVWKKPDIFTDYCYIIKNK